MGLLGPLTMLDDTTLIVMIILLIAIDPEAQHGDEALPILPPDVPSEAMENMHTTHSNAS